MEGSQASGPEREAQKFVASQPADLFTQPLQRLRQSGALCLGDELCVARTGGRLFHLCIGAVLLGESFGLYRLTQSLAVDSGHRSVRPRRCRQAGQYDSARIVDAPEPSDETMAQ